MISNRRQWISGLILVCALGLLPGISGGEEPRYADSQYGWSIPLSENMILYTPEDPGPFTFENSTKFILVNKWQRGDLIMLNLSAVTDEADLDNLKSQLENEGLPKPGYRKVAVQYTSIGENHPKRAVEHIFDLQGRKLRTMRQICFVHQGQGFIVVCTSNADRFQESNREFFDPVLRSIKFE
jgi:hypothetical protein